jgi:hypothetical protein
VNQGPRRDCLMKKTRGRKSRDTVPLNKRYIRKNTDTGNILNEYSTVPVCPDDFN